MRYVGYILGWGMFFLFIAFAITCVKVDNEQRAERKIKYSFLQNGNEYCINGNPEYKVMLLSHNNMSSLTYSNTGEKNYIGNSHIQECP